MNKQICIVLALVLTLSLAGCSLLPGNPLVGAWVCRTEESAEYTRELLESFDLYEEEIALIQTPLYTVKHLTLNRDKTYSYATRQETEATCLREFIYAIFDEMYAGRASLSDCYEWDMSGLSKEEFLQFYASLYEMTDFDALVTLWIENSGTAIGEYETGTYQIRFGKIHMNMADSEEGDGYVTYLLEGDTLTLTYSNSVEVYTRASAPEI